ncbi:uncharacterized protein B0H18DRAFT_878614, partial [Fomitopsis serialis]|uniref:uncharacterized protein n=1 Tax=Fomitopsis serialis TaxID=139415 RepID=UPI00200721D1
FALVITIDKYKDPKIAPLEGCVNDGDDFVDFLTETLQVPSKQIARLSNEKATRSEIFRRFEEHLISNPDISRGDALVFFYASHGDRERAPDGWTASQGDTIETICPYDVHTTNRNGGVNGIPGRTFDGLMRRLAHEKGDNIVSSFVWYPCLTEY